MDLKKIAPKCHFLDLGDISRKWKIKSEMDIKGSKHFLCKLTTNLSTLKVYNFDINNSIETFMLTIAE